MTFLDRAGAAGNLVVGDSAAPSAAIGRGGGAFSPVPQPVHRSGGTGGGTFGGTGRVECDG